MALFRWLKSRSSQNAVLYSYDRIEEFETLLAQMLVITMFNSGQCPLFLYDTL